MFSNKIIEFKKRTLLAIKTTTMQGELNEDIGNKEELVIVRD